MTNREYIQMKIKGIKSRLNTFFDKNINLIAFLFLVVEVVLMFCAIKVDYLFWLLSIPMAYFTTVFVCAVVCRWLDKEHKGKEDAEIRA